MTRLIRNLIAFSLKNRFFIFFCVAVFLVVGVYTFLNMPVEAIPDITNTEVTIVTQWPGRSAQEIERFVTVPIEVEMNSVQRKSNLRSTSMFGVSTVKLIFDDGVEEAFARAQVEVGPGFKTGDVYMNPLNFAAFQTAKEGGRWITEPTTYDIGIEKF